MLRSRLPWQLDLFSSQTKTFVSEITGRMRAWKQADSCSEDLPLAIQIGQWLLLVGFNAKFAFFTVGRWTTIKDKQNRKTDLLVRPHKLTELMRYLKNVLISVPAVKALQSWHAPVTSLHLQSLGSANRTSGGLSATHRFIFLIFTHCFLSLQKSMSSYILFHWRACFESEVYFCR